MTGGWERQNFFRTNPQNLSKVGQVLRSKEFEAIFAGKFFMM